MDKLLTDVQLVSQALGELAMSAREQSRSVAEVFQEIRDIGTATEDNVRSVESASGIARSLGEQAEALNRALGVIRVAAA